MLRVLDIVLYVMSSKRKTSAPTKVLVDTDSCQSDAVVDHVNSLSSIAPADQDYDSDQSHDRSLKVVTSPSSLSADDDDVTDDVTTATSCIMSESSCVADGVGDISHRQWLSAEMMCVLKKIESVIAAAETVDDKRRRVDEMLSELETIRRHLLTAHSQSAASSLVVSEPTDSLLNQLSASLFACQVFVSSSLSHSTKPSQRRNVIDDSSFQWRSLVLFNGTLQLHCKFRYCHKMSSVVCNASVL